MRLLYSEHLIWLVCAAFYLSDHIRYSGTHALLVRDGRKGWAPLIPHYRFLVLNRALSVLNPFTPWATVLTLPWLSSGEASPAIIRRLKRRARVARYYMFNVRIAGSVVFASLFVAGPILTECSGLGVALLVVAPILFTMWLCIAVLLILHRRLLTLTFGSLVWILIECAICPGYFANLWRRLSISQLRSSADAVVFCATTMAPQRRTEMLAQLDLYFRDLHERGLVTAGDEDSLARYRNALGQIPAACREPA